MPASVTLKDWDKGHIMVKAVGASAAALNETAADAVTFIQSRWPRRTGFSANTMEITHQATPQQPWVAWGNITASYALWIEIGARGRPGRYIIRASLQDALPRLKKRMASGHF